MLGAPNLLPNLDDGDIKLRSWCTTLHHRTKPRVHESSLTLMPMAQSKNVHFSRRIQRLRIGENVRFGIGADSASITGIVIRNVFIQNVYPAPENPDSASGWHST